MPDQPQQQDDPLMYEMLRRERSVKPIPSHTRTVPTSGVIKPITSINQVKPYNTINFSDRRVTAGDLLGKAGEFLRSATGIDAMDRGDTMEAMSSMAMPGPTNQVQEIMNMARWAPDAIKDVLRSQGSYGGRMINAIDQGYTTPVWHATKKNFREFLDPLTAMQTEGADFGIHVASENPTAANRIVSSHLYDMDTIIKNLGDDKWTLAELAREQQGAHVMPLLARIKNPLQINDVGSWRSPYNWLNKVDASYQKIPAVQDLMKNAEKHVGKNMEGLGDRAFIQQMRQNELDLALDNLATLRQHGHDAIAYPNTIEGNGEISYLLTDPRQLRSVFAKFDPAKFGKTRDLLASGAGAAVGGTLAGKAMASHPQGQ